ncbi:WxL domain-containing protein [Listeria booriae]|nr:WxL domain-containing protein [Listeria booriae]MBC1890187.1 WxL domain-containing protein [Listeria booriae]MBC1913818.1 WxL domain-containing protein [Listeria booriae]MBC1974963.1 WxL domain-containing protein [Listeria booriae]MBC1983948.1 WxL domain-containing protein [Listeria booriae]MBC2020994.1 WxL domain-containing protein [Listeria booriae]
MKNLTKVITVGAITVATLFGASTFAHADTTTSTGKIKIEADDSAVTPLNPTNPDNPVPATPDPADPDNTGTGNTGALTIDFLSNIDFGTQKVSGQSEKYYAENKNPYIQVTDKRGTGAGWTLTATATDFKDGSKTLKGAEMSLTDGEVRTQSDNQSAAPTTSDVTLNGSSQAVLSAEANAGMGTWLDVYPGTQGNNENVVLYVPAGNLAGDYSSAITWTLEDSPSAE